MKFQKHLHLLIISLEVISFYKRITTLLSLFNHNCCSIAGYSYVAPYLRTVQQRPFDINSNRPNLANVLKIQVQVNIFAKSFSIENRINLMFSYRVDQGFSRNIA